MCNHELDIKKPHQLLLHSTTLYDSLIIRMPGVNKYFRVGK